MGIVAPAVEFGLAVQVHAEVAEELVVILHLRCAPDHGIGLPRVLAAHHVPVAIINQTLRIAALLATVGPVSRSIFEAEVGKPGLDEREGQGHAQVGRNTAGVAVSRIILAPAGFHRAAVRRVFQLEIHDASHGIGPVLRGRAVTQYFHALEGNGRECGQISRVGPVRNAAAQEREH